MRSSLLVIPCFVAMIALVLSIMVRGTFSGWLGLVFIEAVILSIVFSILNSGIPAAISKAAKDNCYRINGSKSHRREWRERSELTKFRVDVMATLVLVALSGNLLLFIIDIYIIPLPIASESLSLFSFDLGSWRDHMGDRNLDREYLAWRGMGELGNTEILEQPHFVKTAFPSLIVAVLVWLFASLYTIRLSYQVAIQRLMNGIRTRNAEYLNRDIGRLQR